MCVTPQQPRSAGASLCHSFGREARHFHIAPAGLGQACVDRQIRLAQEIIRAVRRIDEQQSAARESDGGVVRVDGEIGEQHFRQPQGGEARVHAAALRGAHDRIPREESTGRPAAVSLGERGAEGPELVGALVRRVDEHQAAPFRRRQMRSQRRVTVAHFDAQAAGRVELALGCAGLRRYELVAHGAVLRAQRGGDEGRGSRIAGQARARPGSQCREIRRERLARGAGAQQTLHTALRLARFLGLRSVQVVIAATRMGIEHEERRVLALHGIEAIDESHVLGDVGEVSGVIDMPIVHWPHCALTRAWAAGRMPPPMLTLPRRVFLTAATAVLAASRRSAAGAAPAQPREGDRAPSGMLIVNALGGLEDPNLKDPAGSVLEPRVLRDAHDSGLTAVNVTLGYVSGDADPFEQSVRDIAQMDGWVREGARDLLKIYTADDILRARAAGRIGIIYGFQNAAMLGSDVTRVDLFANLGVRVIQLTYNPANALGDGSMAPENRGLTPFGRDVVERLNARRVMVDLSHSGQRTCLEAAQVSKQPVSINHTGCRALNDLPRNKTDEELALVASKGGFVGIYFMPFLNPTGHATAEDVVAHIDHAVNVCGEDHVGIGTDGSTTAIDDLEAYKSVLAAEVAARRKAGVSAAGERPDTLPFVVDLRGVNQFRDLAGRLSRRGYSAARIEKIMGQNFQRYAREVWGA